VSVTKQWRTKEFFSGGGDSTNSVEDRGQRERGCGGGSSICNPVRLCQTFGMSRVVTDVFSTELGNSAQVFQKLGIAGKGGF
jgi:hypothetical protein